MEEAADVRWVQPATSQVEEALEATVATRRDWVESGDVWRRSMRYQISLLPLSSLFQCLGPLL